MSALGEQPLCLPWSHSGASADSWPHPGPVAARVTPSSLVESCGLSRVGR